jgi:putative membrane protein
MDEPTQTKAAPDLREVLAEERTFLAWIRTGIALMGFGFVVARFGIFLQQVQFVEHAPAAQAYGLSLWFGTALLSLGVVVNLLSSLRHIRVARQLNQGLPIPAGPSRLAVFIALFLALVGLAMGIYLISMSGSANSHAASHAPAMAKTLCSDHA